MEGRVIMLHAAAPAKPAAGQPCNGCGVCCATDPCPVGALLSRRRRGACVALTWHADLQTYRCGVVSMGSTALPRWAAALLRRLSLRWIAAGKGCDCSLQVSRPADGALADAQTGTIGVSPAGRMADRH